MDNRKPATIRPIPAFDGYHARDDGTILSTRGRWTKGMLTPLKPGRQRNGYLHVNLPNGRGGFTSQRVHVLVALAFHGPRPDGCDCSHLNDVKEDCRPENLVWETKQENQARRHSNGIDDRGVKNSRAALNVDQLRQVRVWLNEGVKVTEIARRMHVSHSVISRIKHGRRYRNDG